MLMNMQAGAGGAMYKKPWFEERKSQWKVEAHSSQLIENESVEACGLSGICIAHLPSVSQSRLFFKIMGSHPGSPGIASMLRMFYSFSKPRQLKEPNLHIYKIVHYQKSLKG
jgi:hypothetical protein